uniref:Putative ovule protein n=1 Tax=Solanum chacoense TaxID=4108 RepID=A0A0V0HGU6_SOLCH
MNMSSSLHNLTNHVLDSCNGFMKGFDGKTIRLVQYMYHLYPLLCIASKWLWGFPTWDTHSSRQLAELCFSFFHGHSSSRTHHVLNPLHYFDTSKKSRVDYISCKA